MNHLSQDELIELYYREDAPEGARHMDTCSECARKYEALQADLADMKALDPPFLPENYGEMVWNSISGQVPVHAGLRRPLFQRVLPRQSWLRQPLWIGLSVAATCALLAAAAFYAGRLWEHRNSPPPIASHPAPPARQRVVVVVLSDHLDRSRFRRRHENKAGGRVFQQICSGFRNDDGGLLGSRFVKAHFSRKLAGIAAGF